MVQFFFYKNFFSSNFIIPYSTMIISLYLNSLKSIYPNTVGKPRTDSVPPTMQSQIPKSRDVTLFFFRHDALQVSGHALFTSTRHVFLLNIFINKTERSIHFYWIHFLNKIVTWLTREYVYLWYRLLEINVGTRDTAVDEML